MPKFHLSSWMECARLDVGYTARLAHLCIKHFSCCLAYHSTLLEQILASSLHPAPRCFGQLTPWLALYLESPFLCAWHAFLLFLEVALAPIRQSLLTSSVCFSLPADFPMSAPTGFTSVHFSYCQLMPCILVSILHSCPAVSLRQTLAFVFLGCPAVAYWMLALIACRWSVLSSFPQP